MIGQDGNPSWGIVKLENIVYFENRLTMDVQISFMLPAVFKGSFLWNNTS